MSSGVRTVTVAWLITAVYCFFQYTLRSAPAVMMPQLSEAFGLSAMGVASMVGLFCYGCCPFSLITGALTDRLGPRKVVPHGEPWLLRYYGVAPGVEHRARQPCRVHNMLSISH